ncbi:MAG: hypothetical protein ACO3GT_06645 [Candidatus Nanopelagicales bacterium]
MQPARWSLTERLPRCAFLAGTEAIVVVIAKAVVSVIGTEAIVVVIAKAVVSVIRR